MLAYLFYVVLCCSMLLYVFYLFYVVLLCSMLFYGFCLRSVVYVLYVTYVSYVFYVFYFLCCYSCPIVFYVVLGCSGLPYVVIFVVLFLCDLCVILCSSVFYVVLVVLFFLCSMLFGFALCVMVSSVCSMLF